MKLGAIIIEDDYDSEFRYEGRPTDSLQSMDERGIVAYVGTFSKTCCQSCAWVTRSCRRRSSKRWCAPNTSPTCTPSTLPQWALAKFIAEGCLHSSTSAAAIPSMRAAPRERILARWPVTCRRWLEAVPAAAGFRMVVMCKVPMDVAVVIELAKKVEVGLYAIDGFTSKRLKAGLFIGFGAIETLDIDIALDRCARHFATSG